MKDTLCAYYTNSKDITAYMCAKLEISDGDVLLEPSAGEGIFIDEILAEKKNVHIDALDINGEVIAKLKEKYKDNTSVVVRETDTLLDEYLDAFDSSGYYSKVIGNPPYGAWQDYEKRDILKRKFIGQYVKESYSLFLLRCISVLKMHGKLSFIIPDTYLFLNMHANLRRLLFTNTKIDEILIFPSKFFPGVSFGYSNLSIITLERCINEEALNNTVKVIQGFKSSSEFSNLITSKHLDSKHLQVFNFKQKDILANEQCRFILAKPNVSKLLMKRIKRIGNVCDVVTGFYTGDNLRFIKAANKELKGAKNYGVIELDKVYPCTSLYGIPNVEEGYVPYIKSASRRRYVRQNDDWYVRWDQKTIHFYQSNKKSRFQNSSYYFKTGVGIPMVKSSTIRAFLMKDHVFDQSIVGMFPKDETKLYYFLALMNSDIINDLIHAINPTANNSANYIKQLPYIEPDENLFLQINSKVEELISAERAREYGKADCLHTELNSMIETIYS